MATPDDKRPRILLGVSGGIAAYKSPELVRRLLEHGADVQVVMTRGAREFVSPLTFQAVSGRAVRDDIWDAEAEDAMGHIALARWADLVLIAPATAHTIGALAHGLAGDLLATLYLATSAPTWIAPAMNHVMWAHPALEANVRTLEQRGVRILGPGVGDQACGEHGPGRMLEPEAIAAAVFEAPAMLASQSLKGVRVLVTAGPTREPIDPVRYVTNRSSGKMGYALARAAREAGAEVTLVSGPVALGVPAGVTRVDVETAEEMYAAVHERVALADLFIGCAAVSDYRPRDPAPQKIKRKKEEMSLEFVRSPDTLASVAERAGGPFTVGFAAETDNVLEHARQKLANKGVDMMAANRVGPDCGFDQETNALTVIWRGGEETLEQASKAVLARRLIALIAERYRQTRSDRETPTNAGAPV
jgi:phosphopantothenoylcysteine decarboxylase/phosphopantothenate--cysteine ligase